MRTTVTLDDDIAAAVERLRRARGVSVSEAVNILVRAGLTVGSDRPKFRQRSAHIGLTFDVANAAETLEQLDGPGR